MLEFLCFLVLKSFWFGNIFDTVGAYLMMDMAIPIQFVTTKKWENSISNTHICSSPSKDG